MAATNKAAEPAVVEAEAVEVEGGTEDESDERRMPVLLTQAMATAGEITVAELVEQRNKIVELMETVMDEGVHYGKVPGVSKPTLLKPGAELLAVQFRLAATYPQKRLRIEWQGDHMTVVAAAVLRHIATGLVVAEGLGLCTSRESKYAYRREERTCPECGEPQIRRSKYPPRDQPQAAPGYYCWKKEGGCGAGFAADDPRITEQETGKRANPELPDTYNTVLKMAAKRALVAAVLNATAAGDVFTQDVEDSRAAATATDDRRVEGPPRRPVPRSWAQITAALEGYADQPHLPEMFQAFARAAMYHLFGETETAELARVQKDMLSQKAAGALLALDDVLAEQAGRDGPFTIPTMDDLRMAWAKVMNGTMLETPDYRPPEPAEDGIDPEAEAIPSGE